MNDDCCYKLYMHVNKINGKVYIGQTKKSYRARWDNGKGYGLCSLFAKAIEKYGWDEGFEHIPLIEGLTKSEADYLERFFIDFFDAQNPEFGYNLTAGGDENPMDNPVVRAKHNEAMKKLSADPEWQKNHREAMKKVHADPEWQKNHREALKKLSVDPEWQKKNREALKKMHADPEWQKNVLEANRRTAQNPEWQKNHREALKKMHADPEWQKKNREALKKMHADPEWQKNHREAMKKLSVDPKWREAMKKVHADPEWQKNHREALKKMHADPEWQKKNREGAKKRSADPEWQKKHCKKVRCVETKIVYDSLKEAAIAVNLKTYGSISMCCSGKYKTAGGYHWEYA